MTHNKYNQCPRCRIGNDNDGDGNCSMCAGETGLLVTYMGKRIRELEVRIEELHERNDRKNEAMVALETLKRYLSTASLQR